MAFQYGSRLCDATISKVLKTCIFLIIRKLPWNSNKLSLDSYTRLRLHNYFQVILSSTTMSLSSGDVVTIVER